MNCPHHAPGDAIDPVWCSQCGSYAEPGRAERAAMIAALAQCTHPAESRVPFLLTGLHWCRRCGAVWGHAKTGPLPRIPELVESLRKLEAGR